MKTLREIWKIICEAISDGKRFAQEASKFKAAVEPKIVGFSYEEVIRDWLDYACPNKYIVLLRDINICHKDSHYWERIPKEHRLQFSKDILLLFCKDNREMYSIAESIPSSFATCCTYGLGAFIQWNSQGEQEEVNDNTA